MTGPTARTSALFPSAVESVQREAVSGSIAHTACFILLRLMSESNAPKTYVDRSLVLIPIARIRRGFGEDRAI